jgi:YihY family inner membrane protein
MLSREASFVLQNPGTFFLRTLKAFRANQGLLLAGSVAYYALLSILPLLMLIVIALSHVVEETELLLTLNRYLEWIVPSQSESILAELSKFLKDRHFIGWVLLLTMLFFSSLAFTALENAMSVIFIHRVAIHRRHFLISAFLPYVYILSLGVGILLITVVSGALQVLGEERIRLLGYAWSLGGVSGLLLYLLGFVGEVMLLTSIYLVMPVGRLSLRHALIGGVTAAVLWEITRHLLVWYLASLSQVSIVYGSLTTTIIVLLSLEVGAILLLYGAQVIAEYEHVTNAERDVPAQEFHTDSA